MESVQEDPMLKFPPDLLHDIRKKYNLEQIGAMDEVIDILELWIQKQHHFTKKDFSRGYLERTIIRAKGSVERSKERLDKMCTSRTQMSHFFTECDVRDPILETIEDALLPNLTKDYYRVYFIQNVAQDNQVELYIAYYKRMVHFFEYVCARDYACGMAIVLDFRYINLFEFVKKMNIADIGNALTLIVSGYGFRLKGIYFITTSKFIDSLVVILKQFLTAKIGERILVMKTVEELHQYIDKDILPKDYGGKEISRAELHQKTLCMLGSKEYKEYMEEINAAKTNEALRSKEHATSKHLGIPGTFRALKVD